MKYLVLEYIKNLNFASYDLNVGHMSNDVVIKNVSNQAIYDSYESYLDQHRSQLEGMMFEVIRCDDFDDIAIIWAEVKHHDKVVYDYIGYFKSADEKIHRIDELWCPRSNV